uniref:Uncharacterized protein n=1 Tax=Heterorhabditis bacteriophora TaxID=37862 RepID=A0A1I7W9D4_HETBA
MILLQIFVIKVFGQVIRLTLAFYDFTIIKVNIRNCYIIQFKSSGIILMAYLQESMTYLLIKIF